MDGLRVDRLIRLPLPYKCFMHPSGMIVICSVGHTFLGLDSSQVARWTSATVLSTKYSSLLLSGFLVDKVLVNSLVPQVSLVFRRHWFLTRNACHQTIQPCHILTSCACSGNQSQREMRKM